MQVLFICIPLSFGLSALRDLRLTVLAYLGRLAHRYTVFSVLASPAQRVSISRPFAGRRAYLWYALYHGRYALKP